MMLTHNESSFILAIDQSVVLPSLRERSRLSSDFIQLLSLLANKPLEELCTDATLFLTLPLMEELLRRLLFQYHAAFRSEAGSGLFLPIQTAIESDLVHTIAFLQLFPDGRYYASELQNALRYLEPHKYTAGKKTFGENFLDSSNRLRAFGSRAWRVMNPLLSLAVADVDFLRRVTLSFLYMAWLFPLIRLLVATGIVFKHVAFPSAFISEFSRCQRFKAQVSRYRYLALHDGVWLFARVLGCFALAHASTKVSLALFVFGFAESCVLRRVATRADAGKIAALSHARNENPLLFNFFQLSYQNGAKETQHHHDVKVRIMGAYVGSLLISLIAQLFFSKESPSPQFSYEWMGSLGGSFLVFITFMVQMRYSGNDKALIPFAGLKEAGGHEERRVLIP